MVDSNPLLGILDGSLRFDGKGMITLVAKQGSGVKTADDYFNEDDKPVMLGGVTTPQFKEDLAVRPACELEACLYFSATCTQCGIMKGHYYANDHRRQNTE